MSKKVKNIYEHEIPLYAMTYYLVFAAKGHACEVITKNIMHVDNDESDACVWPHPDHPVVFFSHEVMGRDPMTILQVVCHEALHLTLHVLHARGVTLTEDSEEAYTYLHQYLFKTILTSCITYHELGHMQVLLK